MCNIIQELNEEIENFLGEGFRKLHRELQSQQDWDHDKENKMQSTMYELEEDLAEVKEDLELIEDQKELLKGIEKSLKSAQEGLREFKEGIVQADFCKRKRHYEVNRLWREEGILTSCEEDEEEETLQPSNLQ